MAEHKLSYTASEIDNRLRRVDNIPVVDSELSTTSTNPVQNKVITSKINSIESSLNQKANTSAIPTKTSQLTNNSGFLTSIPSEYVTETELTNKGYATQASVTALSNRIDNLPTGGNITVDSALSSTSTNPVQNKVIYEEFSKLEEALVKDFSDINDGFNEVFGEIEAINNEIDNLSASGGKTLIGEITLTSENVSKTDNNTLTFNDELKSQVAEIFEALDGFSGIIYIEEATGDLVKTCVTTYVSGSTNMNAYKNLQYTIINNAINGTLQHVAIREDCITTNNGSSLDYIVNGNISPTTKFYTVSGGSGSGDGVQPDWNQNDSSAPDYIKNRPFYKETAMLFDEDVTTVVDEDGSIGYEHPSAITDYNSIQIGDIFNVTFEGSTYSYEISDMYFLGNFYILIEQGAAGMGVTPQEYIDMMAQYMPEIVEYAVDTGESFIIGLAEESTSFGTREAGTYHFTINGVSFMKKIDSSFIDWAGGGAPSSLPEVTTDDNDKVLMVVDGKWVVGSIANGDEVYY